MITIIPILLILMMSSLFYTVRRASKVEINVEKHILIRIGVLIFSIALCFLSGYLMYGKDGTALVGMYAGAATVGIWLVYLLLEAILLFTVKQNRLAISSLILFVITGVLFVGSALLM